MAKKMHFTILLLVVIISAARIEFQIFVDVNA